MVSHSGPLCNFIDDDIDEARPINDVDEARPIDNGVDEARSLSGLHFSVKPSGFYGSLSCVPLLLTHSLKPL